MEIKEETIKIWLDRVNEWTRVGVTGICILEMTDAATELKSFLSQLIKVLHTLEPREILSQFPSVPKFLHNLLNNVMVQTTEDLHHLVLQCVVAVPVPRGQQRDEINEKSIKWVKSQIKNVCSSHSDIVRSGISLGEQLGLQPTDLTEEFNSGLVSSLVDDLSNKCRHEWSELHRQFIPRYPVKGSILRNISEMCLPILTKPVARPLIEALLCCEMSTDVVNHSSNSTDIIAEGALSPYFITALKENPRDLYLCSSQGIQLSYDATVSLWMQDNLFLEEEIISLLEICCFERKFMSRNEMKKLISLRNLPRALSENTSLFSFTYDIIQETINQTSGNYYVMKFTGVILQLLSDAGREKNKTQLADTYNVNYANIWSVRLASFVNLLTSDWTDMPINCFVHHSKRVVECLSEIRESSKGYHAYYIWLILHGFPDLLQRSYWAVLFSSEQFVETCSTILLWYHGGGTELIENIKNHLRDFVKTLRRLSNKSQVMTSDIVCAIDHVTDAATSIQPNVIVFIRNLTTLFMLISCSADKLDFHQIFLKLSGNLPLLDAFDQILDVLEETVYSIENHMEWISVNCKINVFTENTRNLLSAVSTRFDEYVSQHSHINMQVDNLEIHASMVNDVRSRIGALSEVLQTL